jgi:hypothetical protein
MIHPDATRDECLQEIGELERQIEQLRTENWQLKQANADLLHDLIVMAKNRRMDAVIK